MSQVSKRVGLIIWAVVTICDIVQKVIQNLP